MFIKKRYICEICLCKLFIKKLGILILLINGLNFSFCMKYCVFFY